MERSPVEQRCPQWSSDARNQVHNMYGPNPPLSTIFAKPKLIFWFLSNTLYKVKKNDSGPLAEAEVNPRSDDAGENETSTDPSEESEEVSGPDTPSISTDFVDENRNAIVSALHGKKWFLLQRKGKACLFWDRGTEFEYESFYGPNGNLIFCVGGVFFTLSKGLATCIE